MERTTSIFALSAAAFFVARPAAAFTEDICYPQGGGIIECTPLPPECVPPPNETDACKAAASAVFVTANTVYPDARSTVHVDATYILAQYVGFSPTDAYWIVAYSEASDRGSFEPRDQTGAVVGGGSLATVDVSGLQRTDFNSGGVLVHFSAPRNLTSPAAVPGIDGLHPDPTDAGTELVLTHLRTWAMAGTGAAHPDCAAGLTNPSAAGDNATGATCYTNGGLPATMSGAVTLFDGTRFSTPPEAGVLDFTVQTGFQIIQDSDAGVVTSDSFDTHVGGGAARAADARLGVYIHAFGDRISHHVCLDDSYLYGPTEAGAAWTADMTSGNCSQGLHSIRHIWETGTDYNLLLPPDRTTIAYLGDAYKELAMFAKARGVLAPRAANQTAAQQLVTDLATAEATQATAGRLAALNGVTCARGLVPFPGEPACPDAGTSAEGGAGDAGGTTGGDAGVAQGADAGSVGEGGTDGGSSGGGGGGGGGGCSVASGDGAGLFASVLASLAAAVAWIARRRGRVTRRSVA